MSVHRCFPFGLGDSCRLTRGRARTVYAPASDYPREGSVRWGASPTVYQSKNSRPFFGRGLASSHITVRHRCFPSGEVRASPSAVASAQCSQVCSSIPCDLGGSRVPELRRLESLRSPPACSLCQGQSAVGGLVLVRVLGGSARGVGLCRLSPMIVDSQLSVHSFTRFL